VPGARLGPPWWEISFLPLGGPDGVLAIVGTVRLVGPAATAKNRAIPEAVQRLRHHLPERFRFGGLESDVPACRQVLSQARLASRHLVPVTIVGESGTGKRTLARAIHYEGVSAERYFLEIDCAGLPAAACETLLFGECGLLHPERLGTLLLREPAALSRDLQQRLLDWLGQQPEPMLRFVAAYERDPAHDVRSGRLIDDLRLALAVQTLETLPLRQRLDDLSRLAAALLARSERLDGVKSPGISDEALEALRAYPWSGNLHELDLALRAAARSANGDAIKPEHLPGTITRHVSRVEAAAASPAATPAEKIALDEVLTQVERRLIIQAMGRARGHQEQAAEILGIWRARLGRRLKALKIDAKDWERFLPPEAADDALPPDRGV
jgi:DNA-binding NtrC family response regulator